MKPPHTLFSQALDYCRNRAVELIPELGKIGMDTVEEKILEARELTDFDKNIFFKLDRRFLCVGARKSKTKSRKGGWIGEWTLRP